MRGNHEDILARNLRKRNQYLQENKIEAYRIYNQHEGPWPIAIDIYKDNAVIHVFDDSRPINFKRIEDEIKKTTGADAFFYKDRTKNGVKLPKWQHKEMDIMEYGHKFHCNLSDYLDTGIFLDHRETRKWIQGISKGKNVLNTFAYTGSFSVYAAAGGAVKTSSVDISKTYCDWIKTNLALNNLPEDKNWVYKMDTLEFFTYAKRKELKFDIIIIDPPTFSKNKGNSFSVQQDHPKLINGALQVLAKDGFILFSSNRKEFKLREKALTPCWVNEKKDTYPLDFYGAYPHRCYIIKNR